MKTYIKGNRIRSEAEDAAFIAEHPDIECMVQLTKTIVGWEDNGALHSLPLIGELGDHLTNDDLRRFIHREFNPDGVEPPGYHQTAANHVYHCQECAFGAHTIGLEIIKARQAKN